MIRALAVLSLVVVLSFNQFAFAGTELKTRITVVNGDQISEFELNGRKLKFSNQNLRREVQMTAKDLKEVSASIAPLSSADSHEKRFCGRLYLEADSQKGRKTFCLNSKTNTGKNANDLARLLALIVKIR